ncbi:MAG: Clp protease ClpP [Solobacterium sp.]|nr:Clp protease ClpP [Solobacterium sp.]
MKQERQIKFRFDMTPLESAGNVVKLYIYDDVTSYGEFDWATWTYKESETSAKYMRGQLDQIGQGSDIELHINSAGGEVAEGVAIYNLLKQKAQDGHKIIGFIDGMAYSVAMVIAMACDEIHMGLGTSMLLHYPWMRASGNADELRAYADQLDALGESSLQLFLHRAGDKITYEDLDKMMRKETMLDPESCLKYGFADVVDSYDATGASESLETALQEQRQENDQLREEIAHSELIRAAMESLAVMFKEMRPTQAHTPEDPEKNMRDTMVAALRNAAERR